MDSALVTESCRSVLVALVLCSLSFASNQSGQGNQTHVMVADDTCRNRVNKPMTMQRGDEVEIYRSIQPSDPATKQLPPHDALSMKLNLSYIRAASGSHRGEYCWVATVNVH